LNFDDLVGQAQAVGALRAAIASGRVAQAYLFFGPDGVGKKTAAIIFAKTLCCHQPLGSPARSQEGSPASPPKADAPPAQSQAGEPISPCQKCPSCLAIDRDTHPDVRIVGPPLKALPGRAQSLMENELLDLVGERGTISIEQIRQHPDKPRVVPPPLLQEAFTKPHLSERKVFILDCADRMTPEAANAMLHLLEEPPPQVVIILVSSRPSMLLPTIVSRCRPLRFSPASQKQVEEVLLGLGAEQAKARSIAVLSAGRVGWAISALSSEGLMELRSSVLDILEQLCETETPEALLWSERFKRLALSFLDELGATSKELATLARDQGEPERSRVPDLRRDQKLRLMLPYMLEIGATWLRDVLVLKACPPRACPASAAERENLINPDRQEKAERLAPLLDHASINACLEDISAAAARLTRNANADLVMDSLAIRLTARFSSARPARRNAPARARRQR